MVLFQINIIYQVDLIQQISDQRSELRQIIFSVNHIQKKNYKTVIKTIIKTVIKTVINLVIIERK